MDDQYSLGIYYGWLGYAMIGSGEMRKASDYSSIALNLGQQINSYPIKGMAYANLIWASAERKLLDQAIEYSIEIEKIFNMYPPDAIVFFTSYSSLGLLYLFKGDSEKIFKIGKHLLDYGENHSNLRSKAIGYIVNSYGCFTEGDLVQAAEFCKKATECLEDPLFSLWANTFLGMIYLSHNQVEDGEELIRKSLPICQMLGIGWSATAMQVFQGAVLVAKGQISRGLKMLEGMRQLFIEKERYFCLYLAESIIAEIYFRMAMREENLDFTIIIKNLVFVITQLPFAQSRAETYLKKVIQMGQEVESKGFLHGRALFHMGLLLKSKKNRTAATEYFNSALQIFKRCNSEKYLKFCQEALNSIRC